MDKIIWKRDTIISLEFIPLERSTFVQETEFSHVFAIMVFSERINPFRFTLTNNLWNLVIDGKLITPKPIKYFSYLSQIFLTVYTAAIRLSFSARLFHFSIPILFL